MSIRFAALGVLGCLSVVGASAVPEGSDSLGVSFTAGPILLYSPETRWGAGAAGGVFQRRSPEARPSSLMAQALYTQRDQYQLGLRADHHGPGNRRSAWADVSFQEYPDRFYGIGGDASDSREEVFTARTVQAVAQWMGTLRGGLKAGALGLVRNQSMMEVEEGGTLAGAGVPGAGDWATAGIGPQIAWDTRDGVFFPSSGSWVQLGHAWFLPWDGRGTDFHQVKLDARHYHSLGRGHVMALQAGMDLFQGRVPFPLLAQVGGPSLLRGYYRGRYRDKTMAALQAEYRFPVWKRLGGAAFAAGGRVAPDFAGLAGAGTRAAGGAGLRYRLNDVGVNLRVDWALDREGHSSAYVAFMEAF
jgi:outer membrane protein assembly factor BamA